mgnify:CR=1 FL=1
MQYSPKTADDSVNLPKQSQLAEFIKLVAGIFAVAALIFMALGLVVDLVVPHIPDSAEKALSKYYSRVLDRSYKGGAARDLNRILSRLAAVNQGRKMEYRAYIIPSPEINALAFPAGNIGVFSGLLREAETENEIAFVLAHEMGHYENRDHLRGIGRALILALITTVLFGADNGITDMVANAVSGIQLKYSRDQEKKADLFAVDLLNRAYGNSAGAVEMIEKLGKKEKMSAAYFNFFSTHPAKNERIEYIKKRTAEMGYVRKRQLKAPVSFKTIQVESFSENSIILNKKRR